MADLPKNPEVGGGEGVIPSPAQNTQEVKSESVTAQPQSEVKNEAAAVQPEKKQELPQPEAIKQEAPVAELPKKDEPKLESVKQAETPQLTPPKNEEPKPELPKNEEPKPEPPKNEELKPEPLKNEEPKPEPPKTEDPKVEVGLQKASDSNPQKPQDNATPKQLDWQQRELELLKKIEELEKVKNDRSEDGLRLEIKVREEEIDLLKARVKNLETELQAAMSKPGGGKNHEMIENIKLQHEELLSKAKGMIFDKTKMVKNQELQIEALTTQVQSLKDINVITKDLLEIRNSEVKAMEERLQAMEARFQAEKDRYGLVLQRAQTSSNINDDLRKEYETQLAIFKELREKYEQRVQALMAENARLKEESLRGGNPVVQDEHGI